jgi:hypothetical protein
MTLSRLHMMLGIAGHIKSQGYVVWTCTYSSRHAWVCKVILYEEGGRCLCGRDNWNVSFFTTSTTILDII